MKTGKIMSKKVYLENLGCAKNQVDAEVMIEKLAQDGWEYTQKLKEADLVLVNTCGFINIAKEESINTFFELNENKKKGSKIVMTGCLAQRYASDLSEEIPEADAFFGNRDLSQISDVVNSLYLENEKIIIRPEYPSVEKEYYKRKELLGFKGSAYLKISEGCDHRCHYCAIPIIRGPLRSRCEKDIIEDAKNLISKGIWEINIIAQDLASYGTDLGDKSSRFCDLLKKLCLLDGDFRLRLLYIHPDSFPMELIDIVKNEKKVLPYFDIPFQHASVKVLREMGRTGTAKSYGDLIRKIRKEIPEAIIRTTILLGFIHEDEETFKEVVSFIKSTEFDWMGSFIYSREEDTPAWSLRTEVKQEEMEARAAIWKEELEKEQEVITLNRLERLVGKEVDVLIEELIKGEELAIGRIYAQAPEVDGLTVVIGRDMEPGKVYRCGIVKVNGVDLEAIKIDGQEK